MSGHCQQDGGFIGDAGCTHPNHQHSELVKRLLAGGPKIISTHDAESALREGFYVKNPEGKQVGFGKKLLAHIEDHPDGDADARKTRLMFAAHAVSHPDRVEKNHKGLEGRTLYVKAFDGFGMMAVTDTEGKGVEYVFTIFPSRKGGK